MEVTRREMIANISHDLRTPLTVVKTYTEALMDNTINDSDKLQKYLRVIKRNNKRAIILLDEMNNISILENPNFNLKPEPIDINMFLKEKEDDYMPLANEKSIGFSIEIVDKGDHNSALYLDVHRLEQILDNIISNSIRYTDEYGMIRIFVCINHNTVKFSISDNGKEFSSQDLSNVFKRFYREDNSRSFDNGHTGLGLYIYNSC